MFKLKTKEKFDSFIKWVKDFVTWETLFKMIGVAVILLAMWIIYRLILRRIRKIPAEKMSAQRSLIITKITNYAFYIILIMYVLSVFGVKLSAIWGAAGVAGVALAFAAQTSVSNIISGIFVISEKALKVGDLITVGNESGIVDDIGLLSVKVHTLDNQMVRIPNSAIINTNLRNTSYFSQRRMTISCSVGYEIDLSFALEALKKAPEYCSVVLKDPAPAFWIDGFGTSGMNLVMAIWFEAANFLEAKNQAFIAIKRVFDEAKIEIPYNKIDVKIYSK
uniref:Mechanosensitive ion channel protein n=1 Tax=uncultured Spirochaetaceae bacterium TaxID=201186 RepID=A0A650EPV2_9SPIO|nr:mechanosensitive ion channel protein [uncultured Spirochaetaceae bacterium]